MQRRIIISLDGLPSARRARVAAGISAVMLGLQLWRMSGWASTPCSPFNGTVILLTLALLPPYLWVAAWPDRFGLATWWGALNGAVAGGSILANLPPNESLLVTYWDVLGWCAYAGVQAILISNAARAAAAITGAGRYRVKMLRSAVGVAGYLLFLLLIYGSWQIRPSPGPGAEASAIGALRTINSGQHFYRETHPGQGFAATLDELQAADAISPGLAASRPWYRFEMNPGPRDASGRVTSYEASATRLPPRGLCRNFYTNESGPVRFTREDRAATAADPPLP
jgi:hypothetical protein